MNAQNTCRYKSLLSFNTIKYTQFYYKELKCIKNYTYTCRPYMETFSVERNLKKEASYKCIKLAIVYIVLL